MITRRAFLATVGSASALLYAGCSDPTGIGDSEPSRLRVTVRRPTRGTLLGTDVLTDETLRRAYIQVPPNYVPSKPAPLVIALHGAGGRGDDFIGPYSDLTDAAGVIMFAPNSLGTTWDAIGGPQFTDDVPFINKMLDQVFDRCEIDVNRIGLIGFSDGASYALSLGLANGDSVGQVIAHSPGFYADVPHHGTPAFFVSHGISDTILPIDLTSRKIVPALRALGDAVTYVEFAGTHQVPLSIAQQAVAWMTARFA